MRLLLDTHVLLWLAQGADELAPPARQAIEAASRGPGLAVSAISFWEVAMLARRGRISIAEPVVAWRERVLVVPGMLEAPVDGAVGVESVQLPDLSHGDPADRFLIATARLNGWRLATRDRRILDYADAGHLRALAV